MSQESALLRVVRQLNRMPPRLRKPLITLAFTRRVRFAGTGRVQFETLEPGLCIAVLRNRKRVQNHIGTIHAAAMALLAETASGAVFGLAVPPNKLPLLKRMDIDYVKPAKGDLRAEVTLSALEMATIAGEDRGDVAIPVNVVDSAGNEPIRCTMTWAWVLKKRG